MSKRRFVIPSADDVARADDITTPSAANLFFKKSVSQTASTDLITPLVASVGCTLTSQQPNASSTPATSVIMADRPAKTASAYSYCSAASTSHVASVKHDVAKKAATASSTPLNEKDRDAGGTSALAHKPAPRPGAIVVNSRQRGNPVLKQLRRVPWEFGETVADYELGRTTCALFLSLKYHSLHPEYVHERMKQLGHTYDLRLLLVLCDIPESSHTLKELALVCVLADCTLIVAFTVDEAARYLEVYKAYENKPPDVIMERAADATDLYARALDCLTTVKSVNRTDAGTLLTRFGSVGRVVNADEDDLCLCTGFGPQKAKRLNQTCQEPFLLGGKKEEKTVTSLSGKAAASGP